jgi:hypothetical protein
MTFPGAIARQGTFPEATAASALRDARFAVPRTTVGPGAAAVKRRPPEARACCLAAGVSFAQLRFRWNETDAPCGLGRGDADYRGSIVRRRQNDAGGSDHAGNRRDVAWRRIRVLSRTRRPPARALPRLNCPRQADQLPRRSELCSGLAARRRQRERVHFQRLAMRQDRSCAVARRFRGDPH